MTVGFRRLAETDLPLLYEWLQRESTFSSGGGSGRAYDAVVQRYLPAIEGSEPTDLYLILVDDRPAGFIQTYLACRTTLTTSALVGVGEGVAGVDLFLADPEQTGKGLGSKVISRSSFVTSCSRLRRRTRASADPDAENYAHRLRAFERRASRACRDVRRSERRQPPAHADPDRALGRQPLDDPVAVRAPVRAGGRACGRRRCCQNSYVSGTSLCPPQCSGRRRSSALMFTGQRRHPLVELRSRRQ